MGLSSQDRKMKVSQKGINLIKRFEGLRLEAYRCAAGVVTIGYGHTGTAKMGQKITEKQAEDLLRDDLRHFEEGVSTRVHVDVTQGQYDALISFAYNVGLSAFARSTLAAKLNEGDYQGAEAEFQKWNKAGGRILAGLIRRREAERAMFAGETA